MKADGEDRVSALLAEAWTRLDEGRSREAADAFGRVLLQDPGEPRAVAGLEQARVGLAEESRLMDARMDEARHALEAGDHGRTRALLDDVIRRGGDRDAAAQILDRLSHAGSTVVLGPKSSRRAAAPEAIPERSPSWSRRALVAGWAVVFTLLAGAVSLSWDQLLARLAKTPSPTHSEHAAASQVPAR